MTPLEIVNVNIIDSTENKAYIIGKITGEYCRGSHLGVNQVLVLVEDLRKAGKKCYVLVMLPDCESTTELVNKKAIVLASGVLTSSYIFNGDDVKHVFIEPDNVKELSEDFSLEEVKQFYLNYTLYNRTVLKGEISTDPTYKIVKSVGRGLYKFKLKFRDNTNKQKTVNCTLWDTVNELTKLEKGDNILIVGSMNTTNRITLGLTTNTEEKDYTTYNMLVQKIVDLDNSPEKIAELLYGEHEKQE